MGQFRRSGGSDRNFGSSRDRSFSPRRRSFGDDREVKSMHRATCSDCGRSCEVPFRPTGEKPVYCSECFGSKQDSGYGSNNDFGRDRHSSFDRPEKKLFSATCNTCGDHCQVPFRPTSAKPVFCDNCFGRPGSNPKSVGACQCKDQFTAIHAKLDRIIKALDIPATPKVFNDEIEELIEEIAQAEAPVKKAKSEAKTKKVTKKK